MIVRTNFLVYKGIINSIRQFQRKLNIEVTGHQKVLNYSGRLWFWFLLLLQPEGFPFPSVVVVSFCVLFFNCNIRHIILYWYKHDGFFCVFFFYLFIHILKTLHNDTKTNHLSQKKQPQKTPPIHIHRQTIRINN